MADSMDAFEQHLVTRLRAYTEVPSRTDSHQIARAVLERPSRRWRRPHVFVSGLAILGVMALGVVVGVSYPRLAQSDSAGGSSTASVASCEGASWQPVPVSCSEAQRAVSTGARVAQTRIWLTSIGAVRTGFPAARPQMEIPADSTPAWVFVYDGAWSCCLHQDENGNLRQPELHTRWWIVINAATGDPIFIEPWSDKPVPQTFAPAP